MYESFQENTDYATVVLAGNTLLLDLNNLRDDDLAMRDADGVYVSGDNEHHFSWDNAQIAAEKVGKRCMAVDEQVDLVDRASYWDSSNKGWIFSVPNPRGNNVDIFMKGAGSRSMTTGQIEQIDSACLYWSNETIMDYLGLYIYGRETRIQHGVGQYRQTGMSVRCVKDI